MSLSSIPEGPSGVRGSLRAHGGALFDRLEQITRRARLAVTRTWRVIHALVLREATTRYGRRSAGYVWALFVPMLQLTMLVLLFRAIGRGPSAGDNIVIFFLTGIIPVFALRNVAVRGSNAIASNRALLVYPQVRPFEVISARTLLELLTGFAVFCIFMLAMFAFFSTPFTDWVDDPLSLMGALGTLTLLCFGAGYFSAQLGRLFPPWNEITSAMGRLLFFTSGVWYTLGSLPTGPRQWVAYNPLAHVIEWIRHAAVRDFVSENFDPLYPIIFGFCLLAVGLFIDWLYRISGYDVE